MAPAEPIGQFTAARQLLREAPSICVLTGAGMSAESGVSTFRDAQTGLWARFDPMQLASEPGFRADPALVWDWYASRRDTVRRVQPNAGHVALARYAQAHPGRLHIVTQNVDDLHQRAGSPDVVRLHGDSLRDDWLQPCDRRPACDVASASPGSPPRCERYGNLVRPGVVWFGEMLPQAALARAEQLAGACGVMLVVGTSGAVYPAAGLAHHARRAGAQVVILNPAASEIDEAAHLLLRGTAAHLLPKLLEPD